MLRRAHLGNQHEDRNETPNGTLKKLVRTLSAQNLIILRSVHYWPKLLVSFTSMVNIRALFLCLADKPGPPAMVEAIKITYTSIKFRWTAPRDTGRSKILVYRLRAQHPNGSVNVLSFLTPTANTLLEHTFSRLQSDTYYIVSIWAYNSAGQGAVKKTTFKTRRPKVKVQGKMADTHYGTS